MLLYNPQLEDYPLSWLLLETSQGQRKEFHLTTPEREGMETMKAVQEVEPEERRRLEDSTIPRSIPPSSSLGAVGRGEDNGETIMAVTLLWRNSAKDPITQDSL